MIFKNLLWIWIIFVVSEVTSDNNKNKNEKILDVFVPTREWQVVKKGQQIPRGLHVKINLETGNTEAKLIDEKAEKSNSRALLHLPQSDDEKLLKPEIVKDALKKIKADDIVKVEINKIKEKFRSYDELKKEMSELNLTPKIDAEVMKDLFKQFDGKINKDKIDVSSILNILEDLDFLSHQFDNALEFVRQNGFKEIIYKNLNSSDSQIKQETLKLFGSLVQNNGKVQIHALETGSINILLRILNLEQSTDVKSRAIFALSCLLRRFPLAQLRFIENGGLSVVSKILENNPIKIQIKLVTLMNDLLLENIYALQDKSVEDKNMLISQYQLVNLEKLLLEQDWCEILNKLLYTLITVDSEDHDSIEKCISAMHTLTNKCGGQYSKDLLTNLQERYQKLAQNDLVESHDSSSSNFFNNLHDLCRDILKQKNMKAEL